jgi:hypothetical protein
MRSRAKHLCVSPLLVALPILCLGWLPGCGSRENPVPTKPTDEIEKPSDFKTIAIVAAPGVKDETLQATVQYVQQNWRTTVRSARVTEANAVPSLNDACLLILVHDKAADAGPLASFRIDGRKAVQNVAPLTRQDILREGSDGAVVFQQLVNKEAMRAIGLMLGMNPCMFPRCCLYPAENTSDLLDKGQNYCPPCSVHAEAAQKKYSLKPLARTAME